MHTIYSSQHNPTFGFEELIICHNSGIMVKVYITGPHGLDTFRTMSISICRNQMGDIIYQIEPL